ncbi:nucleotidyltransferase family protein [Bacteroides faecis]|uniref:Nucleotidyltransferase family protein n=1 Tax=Bacteroides faecis TaxID=674529 RepID=A0ABY5T623_9BACE|nr:nucleotidyltransferase family protein [Bacteroides faecis]UVQ72210.1 nucleotidyltransferase family protein [Bacteroides faecis]
MKEDDREVTVASSVLNLLMLNVHILKHAMGLGVGLRQLCDMARAYYKWHGTMEKHELCEIYRKTGLVRWSNLLHSVLMEYLGVPVFCLPDDIDKHESPLPLFHIIQQGGNFGHSSVCRSISRTEWQRKLFTAQSFFRNVRFVFRYAPWEGVGMVSTLLKGQAR